MSPEQYEKCKATMFKKGNVPAIARDIGSERIDKNGYILVKIQDGHKNKKEHRLTKIYNATTEKKKKINTKE